MNSSTYGTGVGQQEEEIFYSTYEPTKEEILECAIKIGIDPDKESNLLYLARQGLLHPLSENWKPCYSKQVKAYYYYDRITKKSQWEHPIDVLYRTKVAEARKALTVDRSDSTSLGDSGFRSLKSIHNKGCRQSADQQAASLFLDLNESSVLQSTVSPTDHKAITQKEQDQGCLRQAVDSSISGEMCYTHPDVLKNTHSNVGEENEKDKEEEDEDTESNKENNSQEAIIAIPRSTGERTRNSTMTLSSKMLSKQGKSAQDNRVENGITTATVLDSRFPTNNQCFTITGTGSQFLKSNKKPEIEAPETIRKSEPEVKGILRDSSLAYVRNRSHPIEDSGSDDRKSVRFDIGLNSELGPNKDAVHDDSLTNCEAISELRDPNNMYDEAEGLRYAADADKLDEHDDLTKYERLNKRVDGSLPDDNVCAEPSSESEPESDIPMVIVASDQLKKRVGTGNDIDNDREMESVRLLKQEIERERARYRAKLAEELQSLQALEETNIHNELAKVHQQYEELLDNEKKKLEEQHQLNIEEVKLFHRTKLNEIKADYEEENVKEYKVFRETLQEEFDRDLQEVTDEHRSTMATLQKNHNEIVEELERDLKMEEELLKKEHATNLTEMKIKMSHELEVERQRMRETGGDRLYEKVRCEKRLLEDKYKCLKEKYTRLKTDVRISLERRKKRREQQQHSLISNSYDTDDRTNSKPLPPYDIGKGVSAPSSGYTVMTSEKTTIPTPPVSTASKRFPMRNSYLLDGKNKLLHYNGTAGSSNSRMPLLMNQTNINNNNNNNNTCALHTDDTSQSETTYSKNYFQITNIFASVKQCEDNISSDSEFDKHHRDRRPPANSGSILANADANGVRPKRKIFTKTKSASTSKLNATKHEQEGTGGRPCTPVENLRIQLKKLEELEDQIPDCNLDAPYHLRYPFVHEHVDDDKVVKDGSMVDGAGGTCSAVGANNGSSELEFIKHRILLEQDSVMRAKESLRAQKHSFKTKQHEISIKHSMKHKHTIDQMLNEEKELTEMEVSLHRTRALLGEKVIRLRHLERSLQKLSEKEPHKFRLESFEGGQRAKETCSDLSSYSSSGFSSKEMPSVEQNYSHLRTPAAQGNSDPIDAYKCLEHLHAEIQEIWTLFTPCTGSTISFEEMDFLNNTSTVAGNRICDTVLPPTPVTHMSHKLSSVAPSVVQQQLGIQMQSQYHRYTVGLLEKTRDLKNWLRHAKIEHEMLKKNKFG